jgi:predicted DNA-binding protein
MQQIEFRLSEDLKERIKKRAKALEISIAAYLRQLVIRDLNNTI